MNNEEHIFKEPGVLKEPVLFDEESLLPGIENIPKNIDKLRFIMEVEAVIQAIKLGEIEGEYFEF